MYVMMRCLRATLLGLGCLVAAPQGGEASSMMVRPVFVLDCGGFEHALCRALQTEFTKIASGYVLRRMDDLSAAPTRPHDLAVVIVTQDDTMVRLDWRHGKQPTLTQGGALAMPPRTTSQALTEFAHGLLHAAPDLIAQARTYTP
jgi:hypothetical protein